MMVRIGYFGSIFHAGAFCSVHITETTAHRRVRCCNGRRMGIAVMDHAKTIILRPVMQHFQRRTRHIFSAAFPIENTPTAVVKGIVIAVETLIKSGKPPFSVQLLWTAQVNNQPCGNIP